ncbi:MAG: hypothetical protein GXY33_18665 [Phycisphaerae bacterium]|nr:hypothetical protein [Phycisphaerae bacterium]
MAMATIRTIRRRSSKTILGLPVWEIASGPDPENGQSHGHARAVVAIGDRATGVVAVGRFFATGLIAIGPVSVGVFAMAGLAVGGFAVGGLAAGLVAAGGVAFGGVALGGIAAGGAAVGGMAVGHYAMGGVAMGSHVISPAERSVEAAEFFQHWLIRLGEIFSRY